MPASHQFYKVINSKDGNYYRKWATCIGIYTANLIDNVLLSFDHEEQVYNCCNGILHMCKNQPKLLVEEVSKQLKK